MRPILVALLLPLLGIVVARSSYADEVGAREELKAGYSLKQMGNCRDAVPHFVRSYQLEASPKALLNWADCEAQLGDLISAFEHATAGRDLARQRNDAELVGVANDQIAALDTRIPRLTIRLAADAPSGSVVARDGVGVAAISLGMPTRVNPGLRLISVRASGHLDGHASVTLVEGEQKVVDVAPGPLIVATTDQAPPRASGIGTRRWVALAVGGVGVVGVVVGIATGLAANSTHTTLEGECPANQCAPNAQGDIDSFHSLRTVSTVGYVVGAAGLATGAVLWFTAPSSSTTGASVHAWLGPSSAGVGGAF